MKPDTGMTEAMLNVHPTLRLHDLARRKSEVAIVLDGQPLFFTYNARAALYQYLQALPRSRGRSVLLPAFHCVTVVEPILHAGYTPVFYRIKPDLSIDFIDLGAKMAAADFAAVLVIDYCGFPAEMGPLRELARARGIPLIEDCAHSFLKCRNGEVLLSGGRGDLTLYSFYKTVSCFAGGGFRTGETKFASPPLPPSAGVKQDLVVAKRLIEQVVNNLPPGFWKSSFQKLENWRVGRKKRKNPDSQDLPGLGDKPCSFRVDLASSKMPWICRTLLDRADFKQVAATRRRNYFLYSEHLRENPQLQKLFPVLPEDVCPWAFPVLLTDRDRYDHVLREQGVPLFTFGEALHPLIEQCDTKTRADARDLSDRLLLLAIHQNLNAGQILGFADKINTFFEAINRRHNCCRQALGPPSQGVGRSPGQ